MNVSAEMCASSPLSPSHNYLHLIVLPSQKKSYHDLLTICYRKQKVKHKLKLHYVAIYVANLGVRYSHIHNVCKRHQLTSVTSSSSVPSVPPFHFAAMMLEGHPQTAHHQQASGTK